MHTVQVLMSTYNGEKYLRQQLDSILEQNAVNVKIFVRDDGSSDATVSILEEYKRNYNNIEYIAGGNIGVIKSFFATLEKVSLTADYYALADQDDFWLKDKLFRATEVLARKDNKLPLLYCSNQILVDQNLVELEEGIKKIAKTPSFGNALVENICTGCTAVFNQKLLLEARTHIPEYTVMHDWWLYLIASAFGKVHHDKEGYILYRQHTENVVGSKNTYGQEFKNRAKNFKKHRGQVRKQAESFANSFGSILKEYPEQQELLELLISSKKWKYRWQLVGNKKIHRQRSLDNLIFKFLYIAGYI